MTQSTAMNLNQLRLLTNPELLRQAAKAAQYERERTLDLLYFLREVERRSLFLEMGYPSLYEFTVRELKVSQGAAYRRIQSMRLIRELPEAEEKLKNGALSISTAAKVQTAAGTLDSDGKRKLLSSVEGKTTREVERELAKLAPKEKREWTRWLSGEEVQISFCLDRPVFLALQQLLSLRTHKDVKKTYRGLIADLVDLGLEKWNPIQRAATSARRSECVIEGVWKTLTPRLRNTVWQRDGGRCTYMNPQNGARCSTTELLQVDHIQPLALGGKNELTNLRLLCAAHNRHRAEKTFGRP